MVRRKTRVRRRSAGGFVRKARSYAVRGGGGFSPIIQGVLGGVASQVGQRFLPGYGGPLGVGAAGYFTGNATLLTLAGMQTAALLPLGGIIGTSNGGGGGYI